MAYDGSRPLTATDIRESFRNQPPIRNPIAEAMCDAVIEVLVRESFITEAEVAEIRAVEAAKVAPAEQGEKT